MENVKWYEFCNHTHTHTVVLYTTFNEHNTFTRKHFVHTSTGCT